MAWSEERLHRWLLERVLAPDTALLSGSRGHDAVVLRASSARDVICCDQTLEGVHFESGAPLRRVGEKAVGRALSDLAATAATPRAVLRALSAPASADERSLRRVILALARRASALGAPLVGGDLAASHAGGLALTVTALGALASSRRAPGRDRARPGDLVLLTGPVGGASLGRHLRIEPRLREGRWLHAHGATAMMDVSDGLARDLARLASRSEVAIELTHVPVHRAAYRLARRSGRAALAHALEDGEDHELVATVPRRAGVALLRAARRALPTLACIGRVVRGQGLFVPRAGSAELERWDGSGGWVHGRSKIRRRR